MVTKSITSSVVGINACLVESEVDVINSLPNFIIVGLPDNAVNEARERVRSAIKNSAYSFPRGRVIVNLAPADIKKEGTNFDLAIAVGILKEEGVNVNEAEFNQTAFIGELSLDGRIRGINGILPLVTGLLNTSIKNVIVPVENAKEAALVQELTVFGAETLTDVINHFSTTPLNPIKVDIAEYLEQQSTNEVSDFDFRDVKGQTKAKLALEIAAAGGHNVLMSGTPGSGKTLMAKCFASILPPLELEEALELTKIYSVSGLLPRNEPLVTKRPFRAVHHTASPNGIIGGGTNPKPGEITLAHRGVLFLDEMVEFPRNVLEVLRQPLEDGEIVISRAKSSIKYPSKFILVGAMNPCPCGFLGDKEKQCTCSDYQIQRYRSKLSGPLLDRIDLQIDVPRLTASELINTTDNQETSDVIRMRVINARKIQYERYKNEKILTNSELTPALVKKYCKTDECGKEILKLASQKFRISGRKFDRILKLARTIADLANSELITSEHISQALQFRIEQN